MVSLDINCGLGPHRDGGASLGSTPAARCLSTSVGSSRVGASAQEVSVATQSLTKWVQGVSTGVDAAAHLRALERNLLDIYRSPDKYPQLCEQIRPEEVMNTQVQFIIGRTIGKGEHRPLYMNIYRDFCYYYFIY
eukprot:SAG11_NODE_3502_length_2407_cov_8.288128_1_plen_135_part_00